MGYCTPFRCSKAKPNMHQWNLYSPSCAVKFLISNYCLNTLSALIDGLRWLSLFQLDTDPGDLYVCKHRPGPEVRWCVCERMCQIPSPRPLVLDALRSEWLSAFTLSLYLDSVIELWAFPEKFQVIDAYIFDQPLVLSDFQISVVFETKSNWRDNPLFKQRFVGPPHFGVLVWPSDRGQDNSCIHDPNYSMCY